MTGLGKVFMFVNHWVFPSCFAFLPRVGFFWAAFSCMESDPQLVGKEQENNSSLIDMVGPGLFSEPRMIR